ILFVQLGFHAVVAALAVPIFALPVGLAVLVENRKALRSADPNERRWGRRLAGLVAGDVAWSVLLALAVSTRAPPRPLRPAGRRRRARRPRPAGTSVERAAGERSPATRREGGLPLAIWAPIAASLIGIGVLASRRRARGTVLALGVVALCFAVHEGAGQLSLA